MPRPGAPLPFGKLPVESVIREFGDSEEGEGAKLSIVGEMLVFKCSGSGEEFMMAIGLTDLLEAIQQHGKRSES